MLDFEDTLKGIGGGLLSIFALIVVFALLSSVDFGIGFNPFANALGFAVGIIVLALGIIFILFILKILNEIFDTDIKF